MASYHMGGQNHGLRSGPSLCSRSVHQLASESEPLSRSAVPEVVAGQAAVCNVQCLVRQLVLQRGQPAIAQSHRSFAA